MASTGKRAKSGTQAKKRAAKSVGSVHQIHDFGYKRLFSNVIIFRQLLESFVDQPWVKELDFSEAETVNSSFISKNYKKTESDIIYKLKLKNGKDAYVYVLLEFQSSVDRFISVRILNYLTSLYVSLIRSGQVKDKLPPVFPILLYNGDPKWTAPDNVADLIENHHVLGDYGIGFKYLKIIENEYSEKDLLEIKNIASAIFLTENHYHLKKLGKELIELFKKEDQEAVSLFFNWFYMLAKDGRIDSSNTKAFKKIYTNVMEVKQMFATAVTEKDKRLVKDAEARGEAKGEAKAWTKAEAKIKQEKEKAAKAAQQLKLEKEKAAKQLKLNQEKAAKQLKLNQEKMAKQMKSDGVPHQAISKYTKLSIEEIEKL